MSQPNKNETDFVLEDTPKEVVEDVQKSDGKSVVVDDQVATEDYRVSQLYGGNPEIGDLEDDPIDPIDPLINLPKEEKKEEEKTEPSAPKKKASSKKKSSDRRAIPPARRNFSIFDLTNPAFSSEDVKMIRAKAGKRI